MSTLLREDNISKVILYGTKNIELENNEKDDFIRKSRFINKFQF